MARNLRIAVDARQLSNHRTGVGNYVYELLLALCSYKADCSFYLYSNSEICFPKHDNVTQRQYDIRVRGILWQNFILPSQMHEDKIDVYWGSNGLAPILGRKIPPTVLTIHDIVHEFASDTQKLLVRWSRQLVQTKSAKAAKVVLCVSHATAADVERLYGVSVKSVIHPFVQNRFHRQHPNEITRVREKYKIPDAFLLTVGTLEPRKNIGTLIKAMYELKHLGLIFPILVHAGGAGWKDRGINRIIHDGENDGIVQRLGYVEIDDLPGLYSACTAFIMPSIYEGFGMPILEAQLCGAPVLHGSHASMTEAGGNIGVAFDPDLEGIKDVLRKFVSGECGLACRLPNHINRDPSVGAAILWSALSEAADAV